NSLCLPPQWVSLLLGFLSHDNASEEVKYTCRILLSPFHEPDDLARDGHFTGQKELLDEGVSLPAQGFVKLGRRSLHVQIRKVRAQSVVHRHRRKGHFTQQKAQFLPGYLVTCGSINSRPASQLKVRLADALEPHLRLLTGGLQLLDA